MATYMFSIIISVYNTACYLRECLDSVLQQTISAPIEVICVNDGSTNDSLAILNEYTEHYISEQMHIRVISQPNAGLSAARNAGIQVATGEYVLFLDSDDANYWRSIQYLSSMAILSRCEGIVAGNCGGTCLALLMNNMHYRYTYIFNLGMYA